MNIDEQLDDLFPNLNAWHDKYGDLHTVEEAKSALKKLINEARLKERNKVIVYGESSELNAGLIISCKEHVNRVKSLKEGRE